MLNDPIFLRHRHDVWPVFWPFFLFAIACFRNSAKALIARGCPTLEFEVTRLGLIRITDATFRGDADRWKHQLYAASGAYDDLDTPADLPKWVIELRMAAGTWPRCENICEYAPLNWIIRPKTLGARSTSPRLETGSALPIPDT